LLQSVSYAYASENLITIQQRAEQGNAAAQYNLGVNYYLGKGVAQDDKQAVAWYRKAAEQGYAAAQFNLGNSYYEGKGVAQDDKQAVSWYRKAAEQGNAIAQSNLGVMYFQGKGVLQDNSQAYMWLSVAVANGSSSSTDLRNSVAGKLSNSQLEAMQRLAGRYFEEYQPHH
jgi:hypothetical protein